MVKIRCTSCGKKVGVPEEFIGRTIKCPACRETLMTGNASMTSAGQSPPEMVAPVKSVAGASSVPSVTQKPNPPLMPSHVVSSEPAEPMSRMLSQYPESPVLQTLDWIASMFGQNGNSDSGFKRLKTAGVLAAMVGAAILVATSAGIISSDFAGNTALIGVRILFLGFITRVAYVIYQRKRGKARGRSLNPAVVKSTQKIASVIGAILLVGGVLFWQYAYDYVRLPEKLTFEEVDRNCGINLGSAMVDSLTQTTVQQEMAVAKRTDLFDKYVGTRVEWHGMVVNVRDGQVLIKHDPSRTVNEVALQLSFWDSGNLTKLSRGDRVDYSGTIDAMGNPYPFALIKGRILAIRR